MDEWVEEDLSRWTEATEIEKRRVLDDHILREPIRTLDPRAPITMARDAPLALAVASMRDQRTGCVLVVDEDRLAGIVTERDLLLKVFGRQRGLDDLTVAEVMTSAPEVLHLDDPIVFALNKMSVGGFRHVPLVDADGRPVGIVSVKMIVDYIVDFFSSEVLNLPPEPGMNVARSREGA